MQLDVPQLAFPTAFCCNCGAIDCVNEVQDTRVTRYFGIGGTETTFQLPVPVCAGCRPTTRRRPAGFFARLLVLAVAVCVLFLALIALGSAVQLPLWMAQNMFAISVLLGALVTVLFYRLRRPKSPRTSFYQPVRIKLANVRVTDVMKGDGHVAFIKLAFTNPEYRNIFENANRDAIKAGHIAAVKA